MPLQVEERNQQDWMNPSVEHSRVPKNLMESDCRYFHLSVYGSAILACFKYIILGRCFILYILFLLFLKDYNHIIFPFPFSLQTISQNFSCSLSSSCLFHHLTYILYTYIYMHTFITYIGTHVYSWIQNQGFLSLYSVICMYMSSGLPFDIW